MTVNKTKAAARAFSAARATALASVRQAAFASGVSRSAVINATSAALGKTPILSLYNAGKLELQIGFMAAALARKGDNREGPALMDHCRDRLANYAGFGGKGKLKAGQKGRRTQREEEAYASARVSVSGIMRDAGIKVPEARGGDTSKTRKPNPAAKATKGDAKPTNDNGMPAIRRFSKPEPLVRYAGEMGALMLAMINRNAKIAPIALKNAVADFQKAVSALQPTE